MKLGVIHRKETCDTIYYRSLTKKKTLFLFNLLIIVNPEIIIFVGIYSYVHILRQPSNNVKSSVTN